MKLSLKFREEAQAQAQTQTQTQTPLLRAKIPVTILNLPFLTTVTAGDSSDLSFSLRSNFTTGPSLSLSYHPTQTPQTPSSIPFSLSLKSGTSLFGSPHNSPLVFTATFTPNNLTSHFSPAFSLHVKPQFGSFSFFKSVNSGVSSRGGPPNGEISSGSVVEFGKGGDLGGGSVSEFGKEEGSLGFLKGVFVAARTCVPVTRNAVVNFRWGVSFDEGKGKGRGLPALVVNKVSLERVEEERKEVREEREREKERERVESEARVREVEMMKGMCGWMRREMEELQRENREIKKVLEGLRGKGVMRGRGEERESGGKKGVAVRSGGDGLSGFENWRSKKGSGGGNGDIGGGGGSDESRNRESKKVSSRVSDVESELQKAIKAASSS